MSEEKRFNAVNVHAQSNILAFRTRINVYRSIYWHLIAVERETFIRSGSRASVTRSKKRVGQAGKKEQTKAQMRMLLDARIFLVT